MANGVSAPFGFTRVGRRSSGGNNGRVSRYILAATDDDGIFIGDAVSLAGSMLTVASTGERLSVVTQCEANTDIPVGVVVGVDPIDGVAMGSENLSRIYAPASTQMVVLVADDPYEEFFIQSNSSSAPNATYMGDNFDIVFTTAGSTVTGRSGMMLGESTHATTSTLQLKGIGWMDSPAFDETLGYGIWRVMFNIHSYKAGSTGSGS